MLLIAADRADVEIAGQPLVCVAEGDAVVDGLDDGCELRRPRARADAGSASIDAGTAGPAAVGMAYSRSAVARIDAAGTAADRAGRWPVEDGVDEFPVPICQRQR